ncbi:hypothetical protein PAAG_11194 [Paracoccidioides lutzii Pb01]|uniref:Uncharacterized protein n=1 Tax=Paracoccidioides lutzii (strain ATCC MYA-826 / Pb01) TaxID=502779 RepID=A0A0A2VME1_PARBA|nr:hypothetical protein PAAG_11194 [Paracoccidioides lutzii Pb01]KGQ02019.1 hypothetical protein PAAG_11194 [Paracoccidioides lutzii Pb01]
MPEGKSNSQCDQVVDSQSSTRWWYTKKLRNQTYPKSREDGEESTIRSSEHPDRVEIAIGRSVKDGDGGDR